MTINRLRRNPLWRVQRLRERVVGAWRILNRDRHEARRIAGLERLSAEMFRRYLDSHSVRKLQLGSWENVLEGWLSTDLNPPDERVAYLDAARPFPFPDACFDYVYSEHMIEHVTYREGVQMLVECLRILRPGGRIRIATPDLRSIAGLCAADLNDEQRRYLDWASTTFFPELGTAKASVVVNNMFRAWGHQFLYDETTLREALSEAGFSRIVRCRIHESEDPHLRAIENHGRHIGEENNRFETMVFEAVKPPTH